MNMKACSSCKLCCLPCFARGRLISNETMENVRLSYVCVTTTFDWLVECLVHAGKTFPNTPKPRTFWNHPHFEVDGVGSGQSCRSGGPDFAKIDGQQSHGRYWHWRPVHRRGSSCSGRSMSEQTRRDPFEFLEVTQTDVLDPEMTCCHIGREVCWSWMKSFHTSSPCVRGGRRVQRESVLVQVGSWLCIRVRL